LRGTNSAGPERLSGIEKFQCTGSARVIFSGMIQHWHVKVSATAQSGQPVLADWLVECEGEPDDADLRQAADHLNVSAGGPLVFSKSLIRHMGEFPGLVRYENDGMKVWIIPPPAS
jgi:hypothetical protein